MSITRRIFFGAAAAWFSRGLTILLGLVLMPVLFRMLGKEELGLWLLLGQSAAVLGILDFGFGVTLTRRLAFAKGKSGSDPSAVLVEESRSDIADLVSTGLRIYRVLALVAFAVSFGLGFLYLRSLTLDEISLTTVWGAWAVLCLSQALTVWATPWTCLLQGVGHVGWDALIASFTGAATLIAQIVVALCGGGILALAVTSAAGALLQRSTILVFARRKRPDLFLLRGRWRGDLFKEMAPLAWHAWVTALGTVLALNTDHFFVAKFEGTGEIPAYRAAYIILLNLNLVAVTFASSSSVFVAHLWKDGKEAEVREIVRRNLRTGLFLMAAGGAWLIGVGPRFFDLWLGPGNFVGYPILVVFFLLLLLEAQCYIISTASRATEDEAFARSSLAGGFMKLLFSWLLIKPFGLLGIALGTLVAQLLTNHWFMVWRSLGRLRIGFTDHFNAVIVPSLAVFLLVWTGSVGINRISIPGAPVVPVLSAAVFAGAVLFGFGWQFVLTPSQRRRLLTFCRRQDSAC